ncbi:MAG: arylesterase [Steroidobacteraceae bacterium]
MRTLSRFIGAWSLALFVIVVAAQATAAPNRTILVLGDSLSAAYGLRADQGWVALLQKRLQAQGYGYRVVNASASGETTAGGLQRLPRALELHRPTIVILELGANDGLRGLPLAGTRRNLQQIVSLSKAADAQVMLLGMRMPPNYGPRYTAEFTRMYDEIARREKLPLVPFFLEEVALRTELMQADGLHPSAKAQPILLDTLWPTLTPLLRRG